MSASEAVTEGGAQPSDSPEPAPSPPEAAPAPAASPSGAAPVSAAGKQPRGFFQWIWRGAALREARGYRKALAPVEQTRLAHALAAFELAERAYDPVDPLKAGSSLHLSISLYREAAYWALLCHDAALDAATLREAFDAIPRDKLEFWAGGSHQLEDVRKALVERSFVETADLPAEQLPRDAQSARELVGALLRHKLAPESKIGRLLLQRATRTFGLLVLLGAVGFGGTVGLQRALQKPDLAAGKPWRASSSLETCRPAEHYCASAHTDIFFHTVEEKNPWLEIDLGKPTDFSVVEVTNRGDCCPDRAVPLAVEVSSDQTKWREVSRRKDTFSFWRASFAPQKARYVRLRATRRTLLHFEKVAVRAD
jgi:hypothetical protein